MAREYRQLDWDAQAEADCRRIIRAAVLEDLDRGYDWTTVALVPPESTGFASIVARREGVIAGMPAAALMVDEMDRSLQLKVQVNDGQTASREQTVATLAGPVRSMLAAERLMLNLLGRLSGIATLTRQYVAAVGGTQARVYDTRKTTPGWRRLEKYAVRQGGGHNHRAGLFDGILIKDNHLAALARESGERAGEKSRDIAPIEKAPASAVRRVRAFLASAPTGDAVAGKAAEMIVEVEVDSLAQLDAVLPEGPDIVLLDNMSIEQLRRAVEVRNRLAPSVELEASGGVTLTTIRAIAETGVERISVGALTHSAPVLDLALDWR
jgi:nicotinate-nucleotide pyrophosphorylase (carboxylating)